MGLSISFSKPLYCPPLVVAHGPSQLLKLAAELAALERSASALGYGEETLTLARRLLATATRLPPASIPPEELADLARSLEGRAEAGTTGLLSLARRCLEQRGFRLTDEDPGTGLRRLVASSDSGGKSYPISITGLFESSPPPERLPEPEQLPAIRAYIERRINVAGAMLKPLGRVLTAVTAYGGSAPPAATQIRELAATHARLKAEVRRLRVENASALTRSALNLILNVAWLRQRVSRDELLGKLLRAEIVNTGWTEFEAHPEDPEILGEIEGLSEFLEAVEPSRRGLIEALAVQYYQYLREKKGGSLGRFSQQPLDREVLAWTVVRQGGEPDLLAICDFLNFLHGRWGLPVPDIRKVEADISRVRTQIVAAVEAKRLPVPENYEIIPPSPGGTFGDYLEGFGLTEWSEETARLLGLKADRVTRWGRGGQKPREIGWVIYLHRYLVEEAVRRGAMYGSTQARVRMPDLMEMIRLAYGDLAEALFTNRDPADSNTILVRVPAALDGLSWGQFSYGPVLRRLRAAYEFTHRAVADELERELGEGVAIVAGTLRAHERMETLPHRRIRRSRETEARLMERLGGGREFDLFLEVKSAIDSSARVVLPDGRERVPDGGARSLLSFRLEAGGLGEARFTADRPRIDPEIFPYRYLLQERNRFGLLLSELRARVVALEALTGGASEVTLPSGARVPVSQLVSLLDEMEKTDSRRVANLRIYLEHPTVTPFDAGRNYHRFYTRLLRLADSLVGISIGGTVSHGGRTIPYEVVWPGRYDPNRPAGAAVHVIPDPFVAAVTGGPLEIVRDLIHLSVAYGAFEADHLLRDGDLEGFAAALFPGRADNEIGRLVGLFRHVRMIEAAPVEYSGLGPENREVAEILEAASQRTQVTSGRVPAKWLGERLADYFWNLYGIPAADLQTHLVAVTRYMELNPEWHRNYRPDFFAQAIAESHAESVREEVEGFLYSIGADFGEGFRPKRSVVRRLTASAAPTPVGELPAGITIDSALGRLTGPLSPDLHALVLGLTGRYRDRIREGKAISSPDLRATASSLLSEREAALGHNLPTGEREKLIADAESTFRQLGSVREDLNSRLPFPTEGLAQTVAREILFQLVFEDHPISLPHLTAYLLARRGIGPAASAYRRTLDLVTEWLGVTTRTASSRGKEVLDIVDLALRRRPRNRAEFEQAVIGTGREYESEPFRDVKTASDLRTAVRRVERFMTVFVPEVVQGYREGWEALDWYFPPEPSPPAAPGGVVASEVPPIRASAGPAGPVTGATVAAPVPPQPPRVSILPARRWDPANFSFMTPVEQVALSQKLAAIVSSTGENRFLVYRTPEGPLDVAEVDEATHARLEPWVVGRGREGEAEEGRLGLIEFTDLMTGRPLGLTIDQSRFVARVITEPGGRLFDGLQEVVPGHPLFEDIGLAMALLLDLKLGRSAMTHDLTADFVQGFGTGRVARTPLELRQRLNRFVATHRQALARVVNTRRNIGPWAPSPTTVDDLIAGLGGEPWKQARVRSVFELAGAEASFPREIVEPLGEAAKVRALFVGAADDANRQFLDAVSSLWPATVVFRQEQTRAVLAPGGSGSADLLPITDAGEVHFRNSRDRSDFQQAVAHAKRRAIRVNKKVARLFWTTVGEIVRDPDLGLASEIIAHYTYPPETVSFFQQCDLIELVVREGRNLKGPQAKERFTAQVVRHYLGERPQILRRYWDRRTEGGFEWVPELVPEPIGPNYPLSADFPELEEVPYPLMSHFRTDQASLAHRPRGLFLAVHEDGFTKFAFVTPDKLVLYQIPGTDGLLPIGVRGPTEALNIYFTHLVDPRQVAGLPADFEEGGARRVTYQDQLGRRLVFEGSDVGAVGRLEDLSKGTRRDAAFLSMVLNVRELEDIFPILTMLYAVERQGQFPPAMQEGLDQLAALGEKYFNVLPAERAARVDFVRERVIEIYRLARPHFHEWQLHGRFLRHL